VSKVFLITGAGRGMGVDFARTALAAGHQVVATGRRPDAVEAAIGADENLLAVQLDVTEPADAEAAVAAAVERFGRVDVLINNAGSFQVGFFEEISPEQFRAQQEVNLFGPVNVTRAVLPVMRQQRSGMVVSISSGAGLVGNEGGSAYATSKFALEGFMESLAGDVAPYGIGTMIVEPGFFRTELLEPTSTIWPALSIEDYADRTAAMRPFWDSMNGTQAGDPAKLATALINLIDSDEPPARFLAGADVLTAAEQKAHTLLAQADAHRQLSGSLAHDDATALAPA
jgi:NAD(P)-dependent dehydrogenase (short-subunit alcohol dehydrogenase family)